MRVPKAKLRLARTNGETSALILKMYINNQCVSLSSRISVPPNQWKQKEQRVNDRCRNSFELNERIKIYLRRVEDSIQSLIAKEALSATSLKRMLDTKSKSSGASKYDPKNIIDLFHHEYIPRKPHLTKETIISYKGSLKAIMRFFDTKNPDNVKVIKINEINSIDFYNQFIEFLTTEGNANNTMDKHVKFIVTLLNYAVKKGHTEIYEFRDFKRFSKFSPKIYLTPEELTQISQTEFEIEELTNARDWLLIGCVTGLRGGDLINLKMESVDLANQMVLNENKKTKINVKLPLHRIFLKIIEMREGNLPKPVHLTDFNKLIKKVCQKAGISNPVRDVNSKSGYSPKFELVASHICRRTFATNAFNDGIPPERLMYLTGHQSVQMLKRYIQIDDIESLDLLRDIWNNKGSLF